VRTRAPPRTSRRLGRLVTHNPVRPVMTASVRQPIGHPLGVPSALDSSRGAYCRQEKLSSNSSGADAQFRSSGPSTSRKRSLPKLVVSAPLGSVLGPTLPKSPLAPITITPPGNQGKKKMPLDSEDEAESPESPKSITTAMQAPDLSDKEVIALPVGVIARSCRLHRATICLNIALENRPSPEALVQAGILQSNPTALLKTHARPDARPRPLRRSLSDCETSYNHARRSWSPARRRRASHDACPGDPREANAPTGAALDAMERGVCGHVAISSRIFPIDDQVA